MTELQNDRMRTTQLSCRYYLFIIEIVHEVHTHRHKYTHKKRKKKKKILWKTYNNHVTKYAIISSTSSLDVLDITLNVTVSGRTATQCSSADFKDFHLVAYFSDTYDGVTPPAGCIPAHVTANMLPTISQAKMTVT